MSQPSLTRRQFQATLAAFSALGLGTLAGGATSVAHGETAPAAAAQPPLGPEAWLGPARPFSWQDLRRRARLRASRPYRAQDRGPAERLPRLDYLAYNRIRAAGPVWDSISTAPRLRGFAPGWLFLETVAVHVVADGQARRLRFAPELFELPPELPADAYRASDLGLVGFRLLKPDAESDWLSFLGASYFRAVTYTGQFGLSGRGLAIDTGLVPGPEEFPIFRQFWLEAPTDRADEVTVYALMDSPSVAGAYRFVCRWGAPTIMDVTAEVTFRHGVRRVGVAPLTSMYWFGENDTRTRADWRPEVHDSDGLSIAQQDGTWIWRPLGNPRHLRLSDVATGLPRGFGLIQRDRDFANYLDDGVYYERRPSLWVEPAGTGDDWGGSGGDWGPGKVALVEIPTQDEFLDNIVAFWAPDQSPAPGVSLPMHYRLLWADGDPLAIPLMKVVATRFGLYDTHIPRDQAAGKHRWAIDFAWPAAPFGPGPEQDPFELDLQVTGAKVVNAHGFKVIPVPIWRVIVDIDVDPSTAPERTRAEIRLALRRNGRIVSETWVNSD